MKRININTSEDLYKRWTNAVPYGMRTLVLNALIEMTCILVEKIGQRVLGLILEKKLPIVGLDDDMAKKSQMSNVQTADIEKTPQTSRGQKWQKSQSLLFVRGRGFTESGVLKWTKTKRLS